MTRNQPVSKLRQYINKLEDPYKKGLAGDLAIQTVDKYWLEVTKFANTINKNMKSLRT